jgi:hypothetical protein
MSVASEGKVSRQYGLHKGKGVMTSCQRVHLLLALPPQSRAGVEGNLKAVPHRPSQDIV